MFRIREMTENEGLLFLASFLVVAVTYVLYII